MVVLQQVAEVLRDSVVAWAQTAASSPRVTEVATLPQQASRERRDPSALQTAPLHLIQNLTPIPSPIPAALVVPLLEVAAVLEGGDISVFPNTPMQGLRRTTTPLHTCRELCHMDKCRIGE